MAQVWLVTGSSRGLGRAIVEAGLAAGNKVLATARDIESLHDLSERHGDQIKLFALEVVINNAGYGNLSPPLCAKTFQRKPLCSRRHDSGGATIGADHRKEVTPMEKAEANHVQPDSDTTMGSATAYGFSG